VHPFGQYGVVRPLVDKIRVLLANHPMMIPDAIRQLVAEQDDMELVGDCRGPMNILRETGRTMADAVVLAHDDEDDSGLCSQLLSVYPDLTILSVASDLATAFTQQLCATRRDFVTMQRQDIVQSLRVVVREPCREQNH
jgi:DNA-binding NarL/FixJ family response regulator